MSLSRRCGESVVANGQAPSEAGPPSVSAEARTVRSHPSRLSSELSERESVPVEGKARNKPYARTARSEDQSRSESSELPYPEAPLASRKATSSEGGGGVSQASDAGLLRRAERREVAGAGNEPGASSPSEEFSTRAENQAEALAVERHQERKHGADFKKPPRYIDPEVLRAFHDTDPDCISCGYYRVSAHHLVPRSKGGDDVAANLIPLCGMCHGCLHSGGKWQAYGVSATAEQVRERVGRALTAENLNYVKSKLGVGAAAFLSKYGVEE